MNSTEILAKKLKQLYSYQSLNQMTIELIAAYQAKSQNLIQAIAHKVLDSSEESFTRQFSKIIQLFHPDKETYWKQRIDELLEYEDLEELRKLNSITSVQTLLKEGVREQETIDSEVDFESEYVWEEQADAYSFHEEEEFMEEEIMDEEPDYISFYEAIKLRELGDLNKTFPTYYLEDFDEFELASSKIDSLDGLQYCKHVEILDVSDNEIADLSELWELTQVKELYLAHNQISDIDVLSNLVELKSLDISFNQVDDISPLFMLEELEFVNLMANPIPKIQIEKLKDKGVQILF